jgi:hypothetical protein
MMTGDMAVKARSAGTETWGAAWGTRKGARKKKASQPAIEEATEAGNPEPDTGEQKRLGQEAHRVMRLRFSMMVERLVGRTLMGDQRSSNHLVKLSDKEAKEAEAKAALDHGPRRSQALIWASEPAWQEEVDQETAETDYGSREME